MSSGTYINENVNGSPNKRRAKPLSGASAYNPNQTREKPKSANGIAGDSLRDTSVNVASAFHQAVQDFTMSQPMTNGYSTAIRNGTDGLASRGLGAPPPSRAKKPTSRRLNVPDASEDDIDGARVRGKSPLAEAASTFVRALSPGGSLYLRQRAGVGEDDAPYQSLTGAFSGMNPTSSQGSTQPLGTQSQTSHGNLSSDYNYSREESMVNRMDPPAKPISAAKKRLTHRQSGTISLDKQAYKPQEDEEEDDDDWSEDEKGHRRRRTKGGVTQKKLEHLPMVGAQAKHRRRRKAKNGQDEGSESESLHPGDIRSLRGSVPPQKDSFDSAGYAGDATVSMEQPEEHFADEYGIADSQAHPGQDSFSIGGLLGKVVNLAVRLFASVVTFTIGTASTLVVLVVRLAASFLDVMIVQPATFVTDRAQKIFGALDLSAIGKWIIAALVIWMFINSVTGPGSSVGTGPRDNWWPWKSYQPVIREDTLPGESSAAILNLARRLQEMENKLIDMQFSQRRAFDRLDSQARIADESTSKLDTLDSAISREAKARNDAEEKLRSSTAAAVTNLRSEVSSLITQLGHHDKSVSVPDEKIITMERRLQAAEVGVKDALEASKQALSAASSKAVAQPSDNSASRWWEKLAGSDGKSLTIRSSSGQDVTGLIGSLVDSAVLRWSKDDIAKPDYASYFAGGRVVPQLTTQTYKIPTASSWGSWGWLGSSSVEGRPPITALHPDIHVGNCWPFRGFDGQIGVMLARSIIITEFTIDHAAKEVAFDVRSAPKKMEVWGLVDGAQNVKKVADYHKRREQRYRDQVTAAGREGRAPPPPEDPYPPTLPPDSHYLRLAQFTYDVKAHSHIQTFSVPQEIQDLGVDIGVVVLMVKSNWGEPNWTCLYRFRVHGHDMDRRPYPLSGIDDAESSH